MWPSVEVVETFGVRVVAPLGGRLNQHWLVDARGERLVSRRWATPADDVAYELRLLARVAALGWPVAPAIAEPVELDGQVWGLFPFLPGEPASVADPLAEQRARGHLLATVHADLARLGDLGQRRGWRRCEAILSDQTLDRILAQHERARAEEVRLLRWHLDRARTRLAGLRPQDRPGQIIHGDFTAWNLRFQGEQLSGILDFELAHWNHRVADFALSWRGKYDAVIHGYTEVAPLEPEEWELLTPMWWAWLIEGACRDLAAGTHDDGWTTKQLLRRSPLMGRDAAPFR
jgi:aminoglycoside phosphotransferase (APT) family kinase protein